MRTTLTLLLLLTNCLFFSFNNVSAQTLTPKYGVSMAPISQGYYEYLPKGYSSSGTQTYPLLLFFHGSSERGTGDSADLPLVLDNATANQIGVQKDFPDSFVVDGQTFEFIVLMPQMCCWPGAQPSDVNDMINFAIQNYKVDITRIYLTGLSEGGGSVWEYAAFSKAYASRIAAMVPIAGASEPTQAKADTIASGNIAIWATHNTGDNSVPDTWTIDYVNEINAAPIPPTPPAQMTIFQTGADDHDAWDSTDDLTYNFAGSNPPLNVYQWMLQFSRTGGGPLAISGLVFNAQASNNDVLLSWKTYSEINNRGFEIDRSSDGITFDSIGFLGSRSINDNGADYSFVDLSPLSGKNYYRLKQEDISGAISFSGVQFVDLNKPGAIKLFPNPASDIINLSADHNFNNAILKIWNESGQLTKQVLLNGSNIGVSVKDLPSGGVYSAEIIETSGNTNLRFIKQ